MSAAPLRIRAEPFARLPAGLHHTGEPTDWVRATRPGQRLHSFLEGPCFDPAGNLWLVDVPYGRIFRLSPQGDWTLALRYDGEPHGLRHRADGRFLVSDYRRGLLSFDPTSGSIDPVSASVNTENFRGLSDLAIAGNGDVWFTDPGRSSLADSTGRLLRQRAGEDAPTIVLSNIPYPNGVALSGDGRWLYLAVTRANAVWRLAASAPGHAPPMTGLYLQLSGGLGPDGLAVDAQDRLAVAQAQAGRAYLFDRNGDALAVVHTPGGSWTTACAFGPDGAVFVVEAETGTIYRASLDGVPALADPFATEPCR